MLRVYSCVVALWLGVSACTLAPEPPEEPRAVVSLSARYDQPTANVDEVVAEQVFEGSLPNYTELKTLAGLAFVRGVVAKALKTPDLGEPAQGLDVQGSISVHTPCRGWDPQAPPDEAADGYIDLLIGVDESRVQRAFTGSATNCRFLAKLGDQRAKVKASMQLEVDLGRSLALGDPVPPILLRASQLTAALSVELPPGFADGLWAAFADALFPDGLQLQLDSAQRVLSLRVANDELVETLIDLERLDVGASGTLLLGLRDDGSLDLRGRDGAWNCSSDRDVTCVRSD